jgi:hypothetical protein
VEGVSLRGPLGRFFCALSIKICGFALSVITAAIFAPTRRSRLFRLDRISAVRAFRRYVRQNSRLNSDLLCGLALLDNSGDRRNHRLGHQIAADLGLDVHPDPRAGNLGTRPAQQKKEHENQYDRPVAQDVQPPVVIVSNRIVETPFRQENRTCARTTLLTFHWQWKILLAFRPTRQCHEDSRETRGSSGRQREQLDRR